MKYLGDDLALRAMYPEIAAVLNLEKKEFLFVKTWDDKFVLRRDMKRQTEHE